ncbi:hypothetical protein [Nocardia seriolae]|nr:hypothetical protein [Nocardia seriolae]APA94218.1 hypothetical protein NS506_00131 [Nocardia seriolae]MTJ60555.1 hypothetical protein [Nocardia seriolae]MTJ72214.1 hypothetical protein [Nocardia seriolae]MTJ84561.1 hypothetical protein [Nocardia seriolae]MTK28549.1 hypothetical protein [Nocardia seriolae]
MVPPGVSRPSPEDVRTACQLWYAALGVGVVQLVATLVAQYGQRHELAQQMFDQVKAQQPAVTLAQVQTWTVIVFFLVAVFWLVLTGAAVGVVYQLGRGKAWARALLTGFGVFLVLGAAGTLFGIGVKHSAAALVAGGANIVEAVLAGGAVFLCYRSESEAYFRPGAQ